MLDLLLLLSCMPKRGASETARNGWVRDMGDREARTILGRSGLSVDGRPPMLRKRGPTLRRMSLR